MGMHDRWSGEYEYDIEVLPLVPPMSKGNSHEAKVARFDRRQRSSRPELASVDLQTDPLPFLSSLACASERAYASLVAFS